MAKLAEYLKTFTQSSKIILLGPMNLNWKILDDWQEPLIYVDGGLRHRPEARQNAGFAVGDSDSTEKDLDEKLPQQKDFSDLCYVLSKIPQHFNEIICLGFLGGRSDHHLINFGEVAHFLQNRKQCRVCFEDRVLAYANGQWRFKHHGLFSLFSFQNNKINITGACDYKFKGILKAHSSHGLSNHGLGEISIHCQSPLFVFLNKPS